jgi:hypothetical protein
VPAGGVLGGAVVGVLHSLADLMLGLRLLAGCTTCLRRPGRPIQAVRRPGGSSGSSPAGVLQSKCFRRERRILFEVHKAD